MQHLNKPASPADIHAVEQETGLSLPEDYKHFLKHHNGEDGTSWLAILGDGNQLLPCDGIISQYKLDQDIAREFYDPDMETIEFWKDRTASGVIFVDGPVKPLMRHPKWLPFTCMNGDVYRYFDYDPAPGGTPGQIIEVDPENCSYTRLAATFSELVDSYLAELQSGVYSVSGDGFIERTTEKDLSPGMPEWLKNA
ncbi:SMI1/KNR4 family protein [Marinobacter sp. X15-166B]|uniref:SMI1/KNR4 family protein n=1 Tax=Marinobacter sp. X15-166B TaxID=1897620 RepID=UPI00085C55C3|nr:SMI1/KNR4 family protein [Marinobacter sp. X15-166B]OEY67333.1 hypothetical protein BG841_13370 [Marinobacter sp. X15-166B]